MPGANNPSKDVSRFNFPSQQGGKEAITRILNAYGMNTRQALYGHLGVS